MYYVYMIRCADNSIYTGITTDIKRRVNEHLKKQEKGAKYTHSHTVVNLECAWSTENRALASKLEFRIKKLSKYKKEQLIITNDFEKIFDDRIESDKYIRVNSKSII